MSDDRDDYVDHDLPSPWQADFIVPVVVVALAAMGFGVYLVSLWLRVL